MCTGCSKVAHSANNTHICHTAHVPERCAQVLATQRMLESKYRDAQRGADDWQRRAELAVRAGNDELAREALRRKKAFSVRVVPF